MVGQSSPASRAVGARSCPPYFSVKEAVFPFIKFPGVDPILGPEMRSTGEVMGMGRTFGEALLKSQLGAGSRLPTRGTVFISVKHADKPRAAKVARELHATRLSARGDARHGRGDRRGGRPGAADQQGEGRPAAHRRLLKDGEIQLVINTVEETRRRSPTRATSAQRRWPSG